MLLIKNATVKTMVSPDLINGSILIGDDGKIQKIGKRITAPEGAVIVDAQKRLVTPGLIDAHTHIGLDEEAMRWEGQDYNEKGDPITPQMRAIDGIRPQDEAFRLALSHGVTCACTGPGSANVIGGSAVVIKLFGACVDDMIVKFPAAMKCAFGENPKNVYGQAMKKSPFTRMGTAALLRETLSKAKAYTEEKESGKEVKFDAKMEALIPVIKKEIPLKAHAHRADDILTAIRIAKEFDLRLTLDHCTEGWAIADHLAKENYPAFLGPYFGKKSKIELSGKTFKNAAILHKAGMEISIITDAPVTPLQYLPLTAGLCIKDGLDYEEAWKAITINPAKALDIADRVGSLEVGKDADLVIWSADPLIHIDAMAEMTFIEGKTVWEKA